MSRRLLAAVALAVGAAAAGCGGDAQSPTPTAAPPSASPTATATLPAGPSPSFAGRLVRVVVEDGAVTNDVDRRQTVRRGEAVRIEVVSDAANELHVHGYDLRTPVVPGRVAVVEFTADRPGGYEVELERPRVRLFELQVR